VTRGPAASEARDRQFRRHMNDLTNPGSGGHSHTR
jgi:hypothetical protein